MLMMGLAAEEQEKMNEYKAEFKKLYKDIPGIRPRRSIGGSYLGRTPNVIQCAVRSPIPRGSRGD